MTDSSPAHRLSTVALAGLRRRVVGTSGSGGNDPPPPRPRFNDARFAFTVAFERLVVGLLLLDAACALLCFAVRPDAAAPPNTDDSYHRRRRGALLLPLLLRGAAAVAWYAGYVTWAASAVEVALWLRDCAAESARRRAAAAAAEAAAAVGRPPRPAAAASTPWWLESWGLWRVRAADAACCAAQGALTLGAASSALRLAGSLPRLLLRTAHLQLLTDGELDDRTRRAMAVVAAHQGRAAHAEARAAGLATAWTDAADAAERTQGALRAVRDELDAARAALEGARAEAAMLQEALLVAAQDVARMEAEAAGACSAATPLTAPSLAAAEEESQLFADAAEGHSHGDAATELRPLCTPTTSRRARTLSQFSDALPPEEHGVSEGPELLPSSSVALKALD